MLTLLPEPALAADRWIERLGPPPQTAPVDAGRREDWTSTASPADLLRDVAADEDWSARVDDALLLWTHDRAWARLELGRTYDTNLALRSELQFPAAEGWLGLPLPWCARADWRDSRAGCSTFDEALAGFREAGFTIDETGLANEHRPVAYARRGDQVVELEPAGGGTWTARRHGPNPLWSDGEPGLAFDVAPADPVATYPGDSNRLLVDDCSKPAQARAAADRLLRAHGFARLPEDGWYARDAWVVRVEAAPNRPLLRCAVDLWAMARGKDWARGLPVLPGARIEAARVVATSPDADVAAWGARLEASGYAREGDAWVDGGVRLVPGAGPELVAWVDAGPRIPDWVGVPSGQRWAPPAPTLYWTVPNPWGVFPPAVDGEARIAVFSLTEPDPTRVIRVAADAGRVTRLTIDAPGPPAPSGWGPFVMPGSKLEPGEFRWRCLSPTCDPDALLAADGFVREGTLHSGKGIARFYRRGEAGRWLWGTEGSVVLNGMDVAWAPDPGGDFVGCEPVILEPFLRSRWFAAEPVRAIAGVLPAGAEVRSSGDVWAVVGEAWGESLWWVDDEGRLLVQRLLGGDSLDVPAFAGSWPEPLRVVLSAETNGMVYVQLLGDIETVTSQLDGYFAAAGWEPESRWGYGYGYSAGSAWVLGERHVATQPTSCYDPGHLPDEVPLTCFMVAEERR